ncbi:pyridine nucleotide-disulfide oxidoreductase-domain-containing protein [Diaporthe sp. PMI_573]|nr:pyridine nucleotide-disulfide oxidoreductase-domain-containing protein [Diaporthaceae sp. PMI_573]
MAETINVDYLVIGAGAMGMAFVDTILTDTQKTVAIVDRYARPSGHWTVAHLGHDSIDKLGWNKGLLELASRDEICAYYDTVMHQTFLPSGRVAYYPKHEYTGGREFHSILTGKTYQVGKEKQDVEFVTPNDMASAARPYSNYTVIGAGKTGIDACLWLLANGIDPDSITWIMPRDSFLFDRSGLQPGEQFAENFRAGQKAFIDSVMAASSVDDLLRRLVACQQLLQLDDSVWPTMFRCATVSLPEFEQLKKIKNIIRQGHVIRISRNEVLLQNGSYTPDPDSLFVDCSADGLVKHDATAIFQDDKIRLQPVRMCQQVFSAAFIAHVEAAYNDSETKNKLCRPIPHPDEGADVALVQMQTNLNGLYWNSHPKTKAWLSQSRLDMVRTSMLPLPEDPVAAQAVLKEIAVKLGGACAKLRLLMEGLPQGEAAARFEAVLS